MVAPGYSEAVSNPVGSSCSDTQMLLGAYERAGTYTIVVSKTGYKDLFINVVDVTANTCHVNTVTVNAPLISKVPTFDVANGGTPCTQSIEAGILIGITDSASGRPISCGASAIVSAPGYTETVGNPAGSNCYDTQMLNAAYERAGTYGITVSKAGYQDFVINNVGVTTDICHVNTVVLNAPLIAN